MEDINGKAGEEAGADLIDMGIQGGWGIQHERAFAKRLELWGALFLLAWETCARRGELAKAHWTEFDLDAHVWSLPAAHTKNRKARSIPLTSSAVKTLRALMAKADLANPRVFHELGKAAPNPGVFSKSMKRLGLQCAHVTELREKAIIRMRQRSKHLSEAEVMRIVGRPLINKR